MIHVSIILSGGEGEELAGLSDVAAPEKVPLLTLVKVRRRLALKVTAWGNRESVVNFDKLLYSYSTS